MNKFQLLALGMATSFLAMSMPVYADLAPLPPTGGSSAAVGGASQTGGATSTATTAAAGSREIPEDNNDSGCSVGFARNTSAAAAGLIAVALAIGLNRLRRYGMR